MRLRSRPRRIKLDDVVALGDVDDALADFCDSAISSAAASTGIDDRTIRDWLETELVSEDGFRTQTQFGPDGGTTVLRTLEDGHFLRAERRRGTSWFEIAHDRLVAPLRASNLRWRETNLDTLQLRALSWDRHDRPDGRLLRGDDLDRALAWSDIHAGRLSDLDRAFLEASTAERERVRDAIRRRRRDRLVAVVSTTVATGSAIALVIALVFAARARDDRDVAAMDLADAELARDDARATLNDVAARTAAAAEAQEAANAAQDALEQAEEARIAAEARAEELAGTSAGEAAARDADAAAAAEEQARTAADVAAASAQNATEVAEGAAAEVLAAPDTTMPTLDDWDGGYTLVARPAIALQLGQKGDPVAWLQEALSQLGYEVEVDGLFGEETLDGVRDFQADRGLAVTGIASAEIWNELSLAVVDLQRRLTALDHYHNEIDGFFGEQTVEAIEDLQDEHDLEITGRVTPDVFAILDEVELDELPTQG